ncbi:hypothetical protein GCM10009602_54480 [Nocardiopsis tropica]
MAGVALIGGVVFSLPDNGDAARPAVAVSRANNLCPVFSGTILFGTTLPGGLRPSRGVVFVMSAGGAPRPRDGFLSLGGPPRAPPSLDLGCGVGHNQHIG